MFFRIEHITRMAFEERFNAIPAPGEQFTDVITYDQRKPREWGITRYFFIRQAQPVQAGVDELEKLYQLQDLRKTT